MVVAACTLKCDTWNLPHFSLLGLFGSLRLATIENFGPNFGSNQWECLPCDLSDLDSVLIEHF